MAKDFKQAVPTEHKGIVYRSKCEAMFARYLELDLDEWKSQFAFCYKEANVSGSGIEGGFIYEPKGFEVNQWNPDFLVWRAQSGDLHNAQIPCCFYELVEYKPSRPTLTYARTFAKRCGVIYRCFEESGLTEFTRRTSFYIYWGSVFSGSSGRIEAEVCYHADLSIDDQLTFDDEFNWVVNYEDEIRETRFDLEAVER